MGIFPYTEEFKQRLKKEYDLIPNKEDYEFLYVGFDYSNLEEWCKERLKEADTGKEAAKQKISCECSFDDYLKYRPEAWEELTDKLWDGFVDYKDVSFGDKEIRHEQKN